MQAIPSRYCIKYFVLLLAEEGRVTSQSASFTGITAFQSHAHFFPYYYTLLSHLRKTSDFRLECPAMVCRFSLQSPPQKSSI